MKNTIYTANQDIRAYMDDHGVSQRLLALQLGTYPAVVNKMLKNELSEKEKEDLIRHIDAIANDRVIKLAKVVPTDPEEDTELQEAQQEVTCDEAASTKFQIGDRVKIPSKANRVGIVTDIWQSLAKAVCMYTVENEDDGYFGMYAEDQLEIAPLPTTYHFEAVIECNVAVVTMIATQGDKTWVYARGHAHILHDGEVGMAQAVSYASKRMFESLDTAQAKQIYFKDKAARGTRDDY